MSETYKPFDLNDFMDSDEYVKAVRDEDRRVCGMLVDSIERQILREDKEEMRHVQEQ